MSSNYELLCRDGTRAAVSQWKSCHLVRVPFRGIVVGSDITPSVVYNMLTEGVVGHTFKLCHSQVHSLWNRNDVTKADAALLCWISL